MLRYDYCALKAFARLPSIHSGHKNTRSHTKGNVLDFGQLHGLTKEDFLDSCETLAAPGWLARLTFQIHLSGTTVNSTRSGCGVTLLQSTCSSGATRGPSAHLKWLLVTSTSDNHVLTCTQTTSTSTCSLTGFCSL